MSKHSFLVSLFFLYTHAITWGQVHIEVTIPKADQKKQLPVFVATSFNNWSPGDPHFELQQTTNGKYVIDLPTSPPFFEYKFTQGYWTMVEGTRQGGSTKNRSYSLKPQSRNTIIQDTIMGWESQPTYRFYIKSIPKNTPKDASIYIAGNFNNWETNSETYKLQKQFDGTFRIAVTTNIPKIEYKFTRGDWTTVEGQESGKAKPNRIIYRKSNVNLEEITQDIESWEDLSGTFNFFSIYDLLLLFSAFQGILLIIAIPTMQDYNRKANKWLVISIAFTSLVLIMRTLTGYRVIAEQYSKLLLIPNFVLFLYAPLFYFYLQKLFYKTPKLPAKWWLHFIFPVVQFLIYLPYFLMNSKELLLRMLNEAPDYHHISVVSGGVAWLINLYYWIKCWKSLNTYNKQYPNQASKEQNTNYLMTVIAIQGVCLVLWAVTGVLLFSSDILNLNTVIITDKSVDIIWLAFSSIPYFLGYFAIHQPEIFKIHQEKTLTNHEEIPQLSITTEVLIKAESPPNLVITEVEKDETLRVWKETIDLFMSQERPYTNIGLTLNELAGMLKISPHLLSKIINEVYQKNFFDFINSYRIEAFKTRFEDPQNRQYTMLAIAFEVGFNSKTAFNRAFKKMTQQTPREYFFDSREEE